MKMGTRSASCSNGGSSPSRCRNQDSDRQSYTTGFEPQGIRKFRSNQSCLRTQQNLNPKNSTSVQSISSSSGVNPRPSSGANSGPNSGTRKRISIACGRCRRRKIRCSGDTGNGRPCTNCKAAGHEQCEFLRVSSTRTPLKSDLVASLDLDSIANVRSAVPCSLPQTYSIQSSLPLDTYSYRGNLIPSCNGRPFSVYDVGNTYDFSEQRLDYSLHSPNTYTAIPIEPLPSNFTHSNIRNWNTSAPPYVRNSGFSDVTDSTVYSNSTIPAYSNQRSAVDNKNVIYSGISPISTPLTTIGSDTIQQHPVPSTNRSVSAAPVLPSTDNYTLTSNSEYQPQADYPYQYALRAQGVSGISGNTNITNTFISNRQSENLHQPQVSYNTQSFPLNHHLDEFTLQGAEISLYCDTPGSSYGPHSGSDGHKSGSKCDNEISNIEGPISPLSNSACLENPQYIPISEHIEKYNSPSIEMLSMSQSSTGYPTPGSMHNSFSPPG